MNETAINLRCNCGEEWTEKVDMPLTAHEWWRVRSGITCPKCYTWIDVTKERQEAA